MVSDGDAGRQGDARWQRWESAAGGHVGAVGGSRVVVVVVGVVAWARLVAIVRARVVVTALGIVVVAEVDAQFATHDVVVVQVTDGGGGGVWARIREVSRTVAPRNGSVEERQRTCVWVLCETEALRSAGISVVDEAEVENLACAAEKLAYLLFGQSWGQMVNNGFESLGLDGKMAYRRGCCPRRRLEKEAWKT